MFWQIVDIHPSDEMHLYNAKLAVINAATFSFSSSVGVYANHIILFYPNKKNVLSKDIAKR